MAGPTAKARGAEHNRACPQVAELKYKKYCGRTLPKLLPAGRSFSKGIALIMSSLTAPKRLPWDDRWNQPQLEELLTVYEDPMKRKVIDTLLARFSAFDGMQQSLHWHGTAWKWTLQFTLHDPDGKPMELMAYFVPNPVSPRMCIPLREEVISQLPIKRLNRYIRDGIRSSKCAVELHWAVWVPTAQTEVEYLTDLFKRKHKMLMADLKKAGNGK
jgi:hypothetical protein